MNLEQLCQPLINYICEINRIAYQGGNLEMTVIRSSIKKQFERMYDKVVNDMEMTAELDKIRLPLVFFIDHIIKEGNFAFKDQWEEFGKQFNELSGDEKFFDLLDDCLNDPSASATERLRIYYQCMGVGFNGCYKDNPDFIERKMRVCALRIGVNSDAPMVDKVSPLCYENIQQHTRFVNPVKLIKRIFLVSLLLLLGAYIANMVTFYIVAHPLHRALHKSLNSVTGEKASLLDLAFQVFTTEKNEIKKHYHQPQKAQQEHHKDESMHTPAAKQTAIPKAETNKAKEKAATPPRQKDK